MKNKREAIVIQSLKQPYYLTRKAKVAKIFRQTQERQI